MGSVLINHKLLTSSFVRKNASLAWPIAINALLMQSMLIIDTLLVSPLGEFSIAGMAIATTLIAFILGVQFALANGTQLVIGRAVGAKNPKDLSTALFTGLVINVVVTVLILCSLILFSDHLIALLTNDPVLAEQVSIYLSISQYLLLVTACTQVFTAFFNGQGNSKIPFKGYLLELPFNAVVSYFLIFGLHITDVINIQGIGLAGAAFGSLMAVTLRLSYLLWQLNKLNLLENLQIKSNLLFTQCKNHFNEIVPIAANFIILSVGHTLYLLLFSQLNLYAYVAITLIFPWVRIGTQFIVAWAQASSISISQAIGKKQTYQIKRIISSSVLVSFIIAIFIALSFYILSMLLIYIYPDIDPQTHLALATLVPLYMLLPIVRAYNTVSGNILRSLGRSITVLKIHLITQWFIALPICALMIFYYDLSLYWAFSMLLVEEVIKTIPFYKNLNEVKNSF